MNRACVGCGAHDAEFECSYCGRATYCGVKCQQDDWLADHQFLCSGADISTTIDYEKKLSAFAYKLFIRHETGEGSKIPDLRMATDVDVLKTFNKTREDTSLPQLHLDFVDMLVGGNSKAFEFLAFASIKNYNLGSSKNILNRGLFEPLKWILRKVTGDLNVTKMQQWILLKYFVGPNPRKDIFTMSLDKKIFGDRLQITDDENGFLAMMGFRSEKYSLRREQLDRPGRKGMQIFNHGSREGVKTIEGSPEYYQDEGDSAPLRRAIAQTLISVCQEDPKKQIPVNPNVPVVATWIPRKITKEMNPLFQTLLASLPDLSNWATQNLPVLEVVTEDYGTPVSEILSLFDTKKEGKQDPYAPVAEFLFSARLIVAPVGFSGDRVGSYEKLQQYLGYVGADQSEVLQKLASEKFESFNIDDEQKHYIFRSDAVKDGREIRQNGNGLILEEITTEQKHTPTGFLTHLQYEAALLRNLDKLTPRAVVDMEEKTVDFSTTNSEIPRLNMKKALRSYEIDRERYNYGSETRNAPGDRPDENAELGLDDLDTITAHKFALHLFQTRPDMVATEDPWILMFFDNLIQQVTYSLAMLETYFECTVHKMTLRDVHVKPCNPLITPKFVYNIGKGEQGAEDRVVEVLNIGFKVMLPHLENCFMRVKLGTETYEFKPRGGLEEAFLGEMDEYSLGLFKGAASYFKRGLPNRFLPGFDLALFMNSLALEPRWGAHRHPTVLEYLDRERLLHVQNAKNTEHYHLASLGSTTDFNIVRALRQFQNDGIGFEAIAVELFEKQWGALAGRFRVESQFSKAISDLLTAIEELVAKLYAQLSPAEANIMKEALASKEEYNAPLVEKITGSLLKIRSLVSDVWKVNNALKRVKEFRDEKDKESIKDDEDQSEEHQLMTAIFALFDDTNIEEEMQTLVDAVSFTRALGSQRAKIVDIISHVLRIHELFETAAGLTAAAKKGGKKRDQALIVGKKLVAHLVTKHGIKFLGKIVRRAIQKFVSIQKILTGVALPGTRIYQKPENLFVNREKDRQKHVLELRKCPTIEIKEGNLPRGGKYDAFNSYDTQKLKPSLLLKSDDNGKEFSALNTTIDQLLNGTGNEARSTIVSTVLKGKGRISDELEKVLKHEKFFLGGGKQGQAFLAKFDDQRVAVKITGEQEDIKYLDQQEGADQNSVITPVDINEMIVSAAASRLYENGTCVNFMHYYGGFVAETSGVRPSAIRKDMVEESSVDAEMDDFLDQLVLRDVSAVSVLVTLGMVAVKCLGEMVLVEGVSRALAMAVGASYELFGRISSVYSPLSEIVDHLPDGVVPPLQFGEVKLPGNTSTMKAAESSVLNFVYTLQTSLKWIAEIDWLKALLLVRCLKNSISTLPKLARGVRPKPIMMFLANTTRALRQTFKEGKGYSKGAQEFIDFTNAFFENLVQEKKRAQQPVYRFVQLIEAIDGNMRNFAAIVDIIQHKQLEQGTRLDKIPTHHCMVENAIMQVTCALRVFQEQLGAVHGDFHLENVFVKLCDEVEFDNKPLYTTKTFEYEFKDKTVVSIPNLGFVVKIADLGLTTMHIPTESKIYKNLNGARKGLALHKEKSENLYRIFNYDTSALTDIIDRAFQNVRFLPAQFNPALLAKMLQGRIAMREEALFLPSFDLAYFMNSAATNPYLYRSRMVHAYHAMEAIEQLVKYGEIRDLLQYEPNMFLPQFALDLTSPVDVNKQVLTPALFLKHRMFQRFITTTTPEEDQKAQRYESTLGVTNVEAQDLMQMHDLLALSLGTSPKKIDKIIKGQEKWSLQKWDDRANF